MNQVEDPEKNFLEMNSINKYSAKMPGAPENPEEIQKEMDRTKKELEKVKSWIVKKYKFTKSIGILPPQSIRVFLEEEEIPKETEKHVHLYVVIPEEQFKKIPEIKKEIVSYIDGLKLEDKVWVQVKTPVDVWENCLDSKFALTEAIGMSYPLYDKGFLGALRFTEIHKSLVLQKFEKYVVSYVVVGSFIRGDATPTSDVDVAVIINDTDVKRMPRLELKERLRGIIHQYMSEAAALAGVKNTLHIQTYLLTEFWESVKDASPVIFTFIRDGVPVYDRGTFLPWKTLLRMGKLKPTPESIDMFMKTADKTKGMIERRLMDAMIDVYYGVLNPSQAMIMLSGNPPPTHKETPKLMDEIFVKKEKMLKKSDIAILEKSVKLFKEYEHNLKFKINGKEIDALVTASETYIKKLKELRKKIEKRSQEKTIEEIYGNTLDLLKAMFGKAKGQAALVKEFEEKMVKKGKFTSHHLQILKNIVGARTEFKKGKLDSRKVDEARKDASSLINDLIDYTQRCDLASLDKSKCRLKYGKDKTAEVLITNQGIFLFYAGKIRKVQGSKMVDSDMNEVTEATTEQDKEVSFALDDFETIKKEIGDFEVIL
jgi:predicted nucleotidyltransferase/uncharacterized protein (UPF0332 family)